MRKPAGIPSRQSFLFLALFVIFMRPVPGRAQSPGAPDALTILERAAQQYSNLKSYKITCEQTFSSEHPPDPAPSTMTAIEAPGGRFRFEGDMGFGKAVQINDGKVVSYYRPLQTAYTQRPPSANKPDLPKILAGDDLAIRGAAGLVYEPAWFSGRFKSAKRLPDAKLMFDDHEAACYVVEATNDDLKIPEPYPFTERVWIEKDAYKVRKMVRHYITTFRDLTRPGTAPVTYPQTMVSLYPEVSLNEPIADADFQFTPPAGAKLVEEFTDRPSVAPAAKAAPRQAPDIVLTSSDGSKARLEEFRGHPVLLDLWATWCGPCIEAFPDLQRIYERTRSTGLVILSVDQDDDAKVAQAYLEKMHYSWRNFHDEGEAEKAFGVQGIPRTLLIDPKGEIVFDKVTAAKQELLDAIAELGPEYASAAREVDAPPPAR